MQCHACMHVSFVLHYIKVKINIVSSNVSTPVCVFQHMADVTELVVSTCIQHVLSLGNTSAIEST